jgi:hypothetical protein
MVDLGKRSQYVVETRRLGAAPGAARDTASPLKNVAGRQEKRDFSSETA